MAKGSGGDKPNVDRGSSELFDARNLGPLSLVPEYLSIVSADGSILWVDDRGAAQLGYSPAEMLGTKAFDYVHEDDRAIAENAVVVGMMRPDFLPAPLRFVHRDGHTIMLETWARLGQYRDLDDSVQPVLIITSRDMMIRVATEDVLTSMAENQADTVTLHHLVRLASPERVGWTAALIAAELDQPRGAPTNAPDLAVYRDRLPPELVDGERYGDQPTLWDEAANSHQPRAVLSLSELPESVEQAARDVGFEGVYVLPIDDPGSDRPAVLLVWAAASVTVPTIPHWIHGQVLPLFRLVLEQRRARKELEAAASHDALTGLVNRRQLFNVLDRLLARAEGDELIGVVYLDLDHFKQVNDTLGHAAGDQVLVEAARRFLDVVRPLDVVARIGGDEFVVLLPTCPDEAHAEQVARRLVGSLESPFVLGESSASVGASAGVAAVAGGVTGDEAISRADHAMFAAKQRARGTVAIAT